MSIILFLVSVTKISFSQNFNKVYDKNNTTNGGYEIIETTDGGYLITGSYSSSGIGGAWIIKLNDIGDTMWTRDYNLSVGGDRGFSIIEINNNYMIGGVWSDTITMTASAFLMKLDAQGDSLWLKKYNSIDADWVQSIAQTPNEGFVLAGYKLLAPNFTTTDAWVFKTDSMGNMLWQKQFDNYGLDDFFEKVIITPDSNIVCAGATVIDAVTGHDYVVKLNQNGDTIWTKEFSGLECGGTFDINNTADGGFIGCGAKCVNGNQKASIYKLDNLGNLLWYKTYSPAYLNLPEFIFSFSAIHELSNGNFMAAGADYDMAYTIPGVDHATQTRLMEFNALGDSIWSKSYRYTTGGEEDYVFDMKPTSDGGYIMCGYVIHNSPTLNDVLVIKVDSNGCDTTNCTVGVEEKEIEQDILNVKVYPNPGYSIFTFEINHHENTTLEIYNFSGQLIKQVSLTCNKVIIDISKWANGLYLYKISNNKNIIIQQLLKQ